MEHFENQRVATFMEFLKETRRINATMFAERIGMNRSQLSGIVAGKRPVTPMTASKIIAAFPELNPEWILNESCTVMLLKDAPARTYTPEEQMEIQRLKDALENKDEIIGMLRDQLEQQNSLIRALSDVLSNATKK